MEKVMKQRMLANSRQHINLINFLSLCESGTATEVLAHIKDCGYDVDYLNQEYHVILSCGPFSYYSTHPLSAACKGNNYEVARLLLNLGVNPDPDIKWGRFKSRPPRQYAIGKLRFMKLFDEYSDYLPWWQSACKMPEAYQVAPLNPNLSKTTSLLWHIMRGFRLRTYEILLQKDFRCFSTVVQEFICRVGIKKEDYASAYDWLAMYDADEKLLNIFRMASFPCSKEAQELLKELVLSTGLLKEDRSFSVVRDLISPHDLVSMVMEYQEQYDKGGDKEFISDAMDLLLGAILHNCS